MKKQIVIIWFFFAASTWGYAQNPTYDIYITNDSLTTFTNYEFDIMIRATGSTTSFDLKSFQAGIYVSPAFVGANPTIGCTMVAGSSQLSGSGYNGSFQWNNTDKVVNMGFNTAVCSIPTVVTPVPLRIARVRLLGFLGFGCAAPDLQFNYVPLPLPMLRLRTEVIIWDSLCGSLSFYPPQSAGNPTFNGEMWTNTDADGKSPVSPYDNNSPNLATQPASLFVCSGNNAVFSVSASPPAFPAGGSLTYQWQRNCGSGYTNISGATAATYTLSPVTASDNNCQFRCAVGYSCGGSILTNSATVTTVVALESHTPVLCNGGSSTVTITGSGGTPPYTGAGTYTQFPGTVLYNISDNNGCAASVSVTVTQPPVLSAVKTEGSIACNGGSTTVVISASGGTPPYANDGSHTVSAGPYSFTVTDANGCSVAVSGTIGEPAPLTTSKTEGSILCFGDSTTVVITAFGGTPPYANDGPHAVSAGPFSFTVQDANGCTVVVSGNISQPAQLSVAAGNNGPVCVGYPINLSSVVNGGTGAYTWAWNGPGGYTSSSANPVISSAVLAHAGNYMLTVTDSNNCVSSDTTAVAVNQCLITLNLKFYIQGFFITGDSLSNPLYLLGYSGNSSDCDSARIELYSGSNLLSAAYSNTGIVKTNGTLSCTFPGSAEGNYYYIVVKHRNVMETWSGDSILFSAVTSYDFTTASSQAYGSNQVNVAPGKYALWSGDLSDGNLQGVQDGYIDASDYGEMENTIPLGISGVYHVDDINGDGYVDAGDYGLLENNIPFGITIMRPF